MIFRDIKEKNTVYSAVDPVRQKILYDLVLQVKDIPGDMAEIGVYKGGSAFTIAYSDESKTLYACDTFEGLPDANPIYDNFHKKGDFADVVFEQVKNYLNIPNVKIIKGMFPSENVHKDMYSLRYSFVHIDVDLYQPTLDSLNFFYERMLPGGIIISDDYKHQTCQGVEAAFSEFLKDKPEVLIDTKALSCYFVKL